MSYPARLVFISLLVAFATAAEASAGGLNPPAGPVAGTMKPLTDVEPRTAVNAENTPGSAAASFIISQSGSYYLAGNIPADAAKDAIHISADNVTLDLNGFTLDGTGATASSTAISITDAYIGITISNGLIANWFDVGIHGEDATELAVEKVRLADLGGEGVLVGEVQCRDCSFHRCSGAFAAGSNSLLENALIAECTGTTVSVGTGSTVRHCMLRDNGTFGIRVTGSGCLIEHNTVVDTSNISLNVAGGSGTTVRNNTVTDGAIGLLVGSAGNTFAGNIVEAHIINYDFAPGNNLDLVLSEIPQSIDWPARVTLAGDLVGASGQDGITINADDVTIDLAGHVLIGVPGSIDGITTPGTPVGLAIRNGVVREWGARGIDLTGAGGCALTDLRIVNNTGSGVVTSSGATITRCIAHGNGLFGFIVGNSCSVSGCTAMSNGAQGFDTSQGCAVTNCAAYLNAQQGIQVGNGSTVSECSTFDNALNGIVTSLSCTVVDCTSRNNNIYGISASDGSTVARCTLSNNGSGGIRVADGSAIRNNSCSDHTTGPGIDILTVGSRIEGNHCSRNLVGIKSTGASNFITRNTCAGNTTNWDVAPSNVCLVVSSSGNALSILGDSGGEAAATTDPNANFSH